MKLLFDDATARALERASLGHDLIRRRQASFDMLRPRRGDTIVDIGCGNGLLTADLARAVGPRGRVVGVEPSADMRASSAPRFADTPWVELVEGTADALPLKAASADKAVSVQVFEYLDDLPAALDEAARVLRPGGRLVVADMHFDSFIWASHDAPRMARMKAAWDRHVVEPRVPERLPSLLGPAGFFLDEVRPMTICDTSLKPDGLASMLLDLMARFAQDHSLVDPDEVRAWSDEQHEMADLGLFFFSITHFVTRAIRG